MTYSRQETKTAILPYRMVKRYRTVIMKSRIYLPTLQDTYSYKITTLQYFQHSDADFHLYRNM